MISLREAGHFAAQAIASSRDFDLDHPIAAKHLLGFRKGTVGHHGLAGRERDPRAHRWRVQPVERDQHAGVLQRLIVFHHRGNCLRWRHTAGRCGLVALANHQHHESHGGGSCGLVSSFRGDTKCRTRNLATTPGFRVRAEPVIGPRFARTRWRSRNDVVDKRATSSQPARAGTFPARAVRASAPRRNRLPRRSAGFRFQRRCRTARASSTEWPHRATSPE